MILCKTLRDVCGITLKNKIKCFKKTSIKQKLSTINCVVSKGRYRHRLAGYCQRHN